MKILVAAEHPQILDAISRLMQGYKERVILIIAGSRKDICNLLKDNGDISLILFDIAASTSNDFSELKQIQKYANSTPIIVLSDSDNLDDISSVLKIGARAYVKKNDQNADIYEAINVVLSGNVFISSASIQQGCSDESSSGYITKPRIHIDDYILEALTKRQTAVLELLANGHNNKEIGRELGISEGTVRSHLGVVFRLFNVKNRVQASMRAASLGLIVPS